MTTAEFLYAADLFITTSNEKCCKSMQLLIGTIPKLLITCCSLWWLLPSSLFTLNISTPTSVMQTVLVLVLGVHNQQHSNTLKNNKLLYVIMF